MKELKKRFRSLYWQQFSLIAGILLLTLLLLGASFYALSYNYLVREKREEMQTRAQVIAQMTADYLAASEADQEVDSSLSRMAGVASMMTEVNFLICDENGQAMLTTDNALAGKSIRLPEEIRTQILENENGFEGNTTLSGLYKLRQFAVGLPVRSAEGQVVGMVVGLCMVRRSSIVRLSFRGFRPDSAIIRTMFRVGVPAILVQALATVMNLGMNLILPLFTASGVFILGAYFKLQSFLFMPVNGLNNALIPIVSFNYGARQRSRITGVIHFALVLSAAIMAVGTVVFLAIPGPLLRLFDADAAVLAEGISALRLIALSFVCAGVSVILCAALQALGAANSSLVVSLLRQLVLLFPLALLLGALRPSLVWLAFLLSEGAACLTALLLYRRTARGRLAGMEE